MRKSLILAIALIGAMSTPTFAASYMVPATGSIWLAGQPTGTTFNGYFGSESAPGNSPTPVIITGTTMTFSATGLGSVNNGGCYSGPAGGCYTDQSVFSSSPWSSDYNGPDALVGIFTDGTAPALTTNNGYTGPVYVAGPDYQNPANVGPGTYSPALDQIFLIGTGSGEVFNVPTGAVDLYLAQADSLGDSADNLGFFTVDTPAAVPEPATWAMMLIGLGAIGSAARRRQPVRVALA